MMYPRSAGPCTLTGKGMIDNERAEGCPGSAAATDSPRRERYLRGLSRVGV